jgi:hypothetical protein
MTTRRISVPGALVTGARAIAGEAARPATFARASSYGDGVSLVDITGQPLLTIAVSDGGTTTSAAGASVVLALVAVRNDIGVALDIDPAAFVLRDDVDVVVAPVDTTFDGVAIMPGETREGELTYELAASSLPYQLYFAPPGRLADVFAWSTGGGEGEAAGDDD